MSLPNLRLPQLADKSAHFGTSMRDKTKEPLRLSWHNLRKSMQFSPTPHVCEIDHRYCDHAH